mmetsp:Transcript_21430/g.32567  ORF Transcript_21430/g.32567 Transcript_21430/m.32567 type:complete len:87 (-) Transcript_21430:32-292(-)
MRAIEQAGGNDNCGKKELCHIDEIFFLGSLDLIILAAVPNHWSYTPLATNGNIHNNLPICLLYCTVLYCSICNCKLSIIDVISICC